jgi:hypothetical protein
MGQWPSWDLSIEIENGAKEKTNECAQAASQARRVISISKPAPTY